MADIDPEMFGKAIGGLIKDALRPLAQRIAELELLVKGVDGNEVTRSADRILREGTDE